MFDHDANDEALEKALLTIRANNTVKAEEEKLIPEHVKLGYIELNAVDLRSVTGEAVQIYLYYTTISNLESYSGKVHTNVFEELDQSTRKTRLLIDGTLIVTPDMPYARFVEDSISQVFKKIKEAKDYADSH